MLVSTDYIDKQKELWDKELGRNTGATQEELNADIERYQKLNEEYPIVNETNDHQYLVVLNNYNPITRNQKFIANRKLEIEPHAQCLLQGLFDEFTYFIEKHYHCGKHRPYTVFLVYFFAKMCMIDMNYAELLRYTKALPSHHLMFFRLKRYIFYFLCEFIPDRLFVGVKKIYHGRATKE